MLSIGNLVSRHVRVAALEVRPRECIAVMGPSGAGKSLLLRAIVDLDPNTGNVRLGEIERSSVPAPDWRRLVAYVPAESGWWEDRVEPHFADAAAAVPLINALGLPSEAMDWQVSRLSTGERQRLALARALALKPQALLLDEPTSSLDATATTAVEMLLTRFRDSGLPVILVTHDKDQAKRLAQRTIRLESGRMLPPDAVT